MFSLCSFYILRSFSVYLHKFSIDHVFKWLFVFSNSMTTILRPSIFFFSHHFVWSFRSQCIIFRSIALPQVEMLYPLDAGRKLNLHKTFRRHPETVMYVQFTSCVYGVHGLGSKQLKQESQYLMDNSFLSLQGFFSL